MTAKKSYFKKVIIGLFVVILICIGGFYIYASDYYHAKDYEVSNIKVEQQDNYTVYGDTNSKTGLIFYPGGKVEAKAYEPILAGLTEKGICVVLVEMPFNLAVLDSSAADGVINEFTNIQNWYIGGHSLGGAMAASYTANYQDKLKGVVLLIYGSEDGVLNREKYSDSIKNANNLSEIVIDGGNHAQFGNYGEQLGDNSAKISSEKQWNETIKEILNFMK